MAPKTEYLNTRLERDLWVRLHEFATTSRTSMATIVRQALDKHLPKAKRAA